MLAALEPRGLDIEGIRMTNKPLTRKDALKHNGYYTAVGDRGYKESDMLLFSLSDVQSAKRLLKQKLYELFVMEETPKIVCELIDACFHIDDGDDDGRKDK